jgi:hypothetical protein
MTPSGFRRLDRTRDIGACHEAFVLGMTAREGTVWREAPSALIAPPMGVKPSPASPLNRAMTSSVNRMDQRRRASAARPE